MNVYVQFVILSAIVALAAVALTGFADRIAAITGLGRLLVGRIFLAAATSIPELSINASAVRMALPDIAMGGLIGSSLFNLMILAFADLCNRSPKAVFSRKAMEHSIPGVLSICLTALLGIGIFVEGGMSGWDQWLWGPTSAVLLLAYLLGVRMVYFDQRLAGNRLKVVHGRLRLRLTVVLIGYALCALVIILVAPHLANAAADIAAQSGLGNTFVGTTFVALATSLPELVTCITAARMGAIDLAIGNVFGSNTFNLALVPVLDLFMEGSLAAAVSPNHVLTCMFVCLITAVVILGQLYRVESRRFLVEPDAAAVITLVGVALWLIYLMR